MTFVILLELQENDICHHPPALSRKMTFVMTFVILLEIKENDSLRDNCHLRVSFSLNYRKMTNLNTC